jgi:dihydropteroate synthase
MGIVNVTPDSFSDGGRYYDPAMAIQHGLALAAAGADILDLGGESTRPGALPVSGAEQCRRVLPVIQALHAALPELVLSIDTTRAEVAAAALAAGASLINDTSAGLDDPEMLPLAAASGAWLVLMHRQGTPATMQLNPQYHDAAAEVYAWLRLRAEAAQAAGIAAERIVLDPGIGFGKRLEHNLALLANLPHLVALGYPVLIGASRKRMLAQLCDSTAPADQFSAASCAVTALAIAARVQILRVHDVAENYQARAVASAWQRAATQAGAGR